jgi:hypothetical protein
VRSALARSNSEHMSGANSERAIIDERSEESAQRCEAERSNIKQYERSVSVAIIHAGAKRRARKCEELGAN